MSNDKEKPDEPPGQVKKRLRVPVELTDEDLARQEREPRGTDQLEPRGRRT